MKQLKLWAGALGAALLVTACGGGGGTTSGNPLGITSIVSFGDSLSDAGTYAVGGVAAPAIVDGGAGGRYTVNSGTSTPSKIWLDLISTQLALPAPCAAVTGLDGKAALGLSVPVSKPAACTNYAQGGSRVTMAIGPGHKSNPEVSGTSIVYKAAALGQLTYPVKDQIADHLGRLGNGGAFNPKALITVLAGGNDVFIQSNVATAAGVVQALPNATTIGNFSTIATTAGGWTADQVNTVLTGGDISVVLNAN
ncbi:MAG: hypothetical protein ACKO1L_03705, partial [Brachymonas sp.]